MTDAKKQFFFLSLMIVDRVELAIPNSLAIFPFAPYYSLASFSTDLKISALS